MHQRFAPSMTMALRCCCSQLHTPLGRSLASPMPMIHTRARLASSASAASGLAPSQAHILLPQLAPRMEHGRISKWLVKEGDEIKPTQVFMHVETDELTEDGTPYVLEVESHESGILKKILVPSGSPRLAVNSPVGIFEDPEWTAGEPRRGDFLWQAYVKEGDTRKGSCAPTRGETGEEEGATTRPTKPTKKHGRKPTARGGDNS